MSRKYALRACGEEVNWKCEEVWRGKGGLYRRGVGYGKVWIMNWVEEKLLVIMKGDLNLKVN